MESSPLIWQWVIEFLASNPDARTSSLSAIIDSTPFVLGDSPNAVRERLALRFLEEFTGIACGETPPAVATDTASTLASAEKIDASHSCEKVLRSKVEAANDRSKANTCLYGGDLQQFILLKRTLLQKPYIDLLKEKILESSQPDVPCSKECNNLPEVSGPCVNHFTYNCHRDDHGIDIQTMKYASQQTKKLSLIRKYRKLKNLANTPLKSVGGASQKDYSSLQHLADQNALDMQNQQTNVDGTHIEFKQKEKILESSQPEVLCSKECDNLPEVSGPCANHFTYNCHRDDHGIDKFIQTMKYANQQTKKLSLIRKYRKLKNLANTPLKSVGGASQKDYSPLQHLAEQNALDDMQNQQTNVDGTHIEFQMEKTKAIPGKVSAEFHNVEAQSPKGNLSGYASPIFSPYDLKESSFGHESQLHNVLHHDRPELEEVADSDCDDVNLLEQCSMPQPSTSQRLCIKCGSTDQLLNCCGEGCLRAIHERCLGPLASVEEADIFYCPFCSYRNARMMFEKSKRKAQEARKNLFAFYDITPAIYALKSPAKNLIENEQVNVKHNMGELSDFHCKETIECSTYPEVPETTIKLNSETGREHGSIRVSEDLQPANDLGITGYDSVSSELNVSHETDGDVCVNNDTREVCRDHLQAEERINLHTSDADNEQISLQPNKISSLNVEDGCDHSTKSKALSSKISVRFVKRNRRDKADRDDTNPGVIENKRTDGYSLRELKKRQNWLNGCSTIKPPPIRRPVLLWKPEEEEILKEAVQKILQNNDNGIPWIKILEYCRPVLHESRTPIDLKDKWRNMLKKKKVKISG